MEKILLVEPNYKNKYPPIGLMKISTYYKSKGDFVQFHKGLLPATEVREYNRILITTLFTFDFDMCVETIRYYAEIVGLNNVYVGGIAATIMPERFEEAIPGVTIIKGQLTTSNSLGYDDNVNIDILDLDYDILWDISYDYPAADSYFIYTSRGCPRKCPFCAVKTLEPVFYECQNVREQIMRVDEHFGVKKNLLVMDNNILHSSHFEGTINTIAELGFGRANNSVKKSNKIQAMLQSLFNRALIGKSYKHLVPRIRTTVEAVKHSRISREDVEFITKVQTAINQDDEAMLSYLRENQERIVDFFGRYDYHKIKRYVDFNQGLDARLFTKENATLLSRLALRPCRIAFDNIATKEEYINAMTLAVDSGLQHFSNYLLFNFEDKPEDLWTRLFLNVDFCERHKEVKTLFSFPMKYASIVQTNREFVGENWNKKYLGAINIIINVTSGIVAKEKDFFLRAFGNNTNEFLTILAMPDDFIRFRDYFEENGLAQSWKHKYGELNEDERCELLRILSDTPKPIDSITNTKLATILPYYSITKARVEKNKAYYMRMYNP